MKIRFTNGSLLQFVGSENIDCFDDKTEILTRRGWIFFKDLVDSDEVASLQNEKLVFSSIQQKVSYFHDGEMYRIKSKSLDALVTPNHRFFVHSPKGIPRFKYISDETIRHDKIIAHSGWDGEDVSRFEFPKIVSEWTCGKGRHVRKEYTRTLSTRKFVALLGIYLSEGSTFSNQKCYRVQISQIKKEVRREISQLLKDCEINYLEHKNGFSFEDKQLYFYFSQFGKQDSRFIPSDVKNLSQEYLEILFEWMMKGDGSGTHYYTISKRLADDVQEIAIKLGMSAVIRMKKQKHSSILGREINSCGYIYDISMKKSTYHCLASSRGSYISKQHYEGMVHCVSVPSGVIKVRRNGYEYWSGNSLMGTNPKIVVFSEYALQSPEAWDYLRPILKVNGGYAIFISTPRGRNHFWELFRMASTNPQWFCELLTIDNTGVLTEKDLEEEAAQGMSEEMIAQEYRCSFDRGVEGAYYAKLIQKMREEDRIVELSYMPYKQVHTAWDLGWDDSTAIVFFQIESSGRISIIDYEEHNNKTLDWYARLLTAKKYHYGYHLFPHDVEQVDGLSTGCTRKEILSDLGVTVTTVPKMLVSDGIESVRALLSSKIVINSTCTKLIHALENYHRDWDEKHKVYSNKPRHDSSSHAADAMRYLAVGLHKIESYSGSVSSEIDAVNKYWGYHEPKSRWFQQFER